MSYNSTTCNGYLAYNVCIPHRSCKYLMRIPEEHRCEFVKSGIDDCTEPYAYVQYFLLLACKYDHVEEHKTSILIFIMGEMILCFLSLAAAADRFFAPALCAVANLMRLSESVAGVTLLAFGNSAPDIITSIIGAHSLGPELVVCQLLGGGIFVTSVVAAFILFARQFHAHPGIFIRDTIVYIFAVSWLFYLIEDNIIEIYEPVVLVVMYIIYVITVFIQAWTTTKRDRVTPVNTGEETDPEEGPRYQSIHLSDATKESSFPAVSSMRSTGSAETSRVIDVRKRFRSPKDESSLMPSRTGRSKRSMSSNISQDLQATTAQDFSIGLARPLPRHKAASQMLSFVKMYIDAERISMLSRTGMSDEAERQMLGYPDTVGIAQDGEIIYQKPLGLFADLIYNLDPVDDEEWEGSSFIGKLFILIYAPFVYLMKFIIPVIDHGSYSNGWCKLLNTLHCLISPLMFVVSFHVLDIDPQIYIPILVAVTILGLCLMYLVFNSSEVGKAPPYHCAFSIAAFVLSIQMIFYVASQLLFLLKVVGTLLEMDIAVLAMTVLAWGNSVGDLLANTALARAGYPRMAWAGVFGGPTMSVLMGAGMSLIILVLTRGENLKLEFKPQFRGVIGNCFFYLGCSLSSSIVIITLLNFQCRRSYGMYLLVLYIMFFIFVILSAADVIHSLRL